MYKYNISTLLQFQIFKAVTMNIEFPVTSPAKFGDVCDAIDVPTFFIDLLLSFCSFRIPVLNVVCAMLRHIVACYIDAHYVEDEDSDEIPARTFIDMELGRHTYFAYFTRMVLANTERDFHPKIFKSTQALNEYLRLQAYFKKGFVKSEDFCDDNNFEISDVQKLLRILVKLSLNHTFEYCHQFLQKFFLSIEEGEGLNDILDRLESIVELDVPVAEVAVSTVQRRTVRRYFGGSYTSKVGT